MGAPRLLSVAETDRPRSECPAAVQGGPSALHTLRSITRDRTLLVGGLRMRAILAAGVIALGLLSSLAAAAAPSTEEEAEESGGSGRDRVDLPNGSYKESIGIDVPPYHGLEPRLGLSYSSSRDNGFVGVGWKLQGLSVIERASIRFGAPRPQPADRIEMVA